MSAQVPQPPAEYSPEQMSTIVEPAQNVNTAWARDLLDTPTDYVRAGVAFAEVAPFISGPIRYGALAVAAYMGYRNPAEGAAVLGGITGIMEYASYRAVKPWVAQGRLNPLVDTIRKPIEKARESAAHLLSNVSNGRFGRFAAWLRQEDTDSSRELSLATQGIISVELGTVALLAVNQSYNPDRDLKDIERDAAWSIALTSGVLAVQGAAITAGIDISLREPRMAAGAAGVAAGGFLARYLWRRRRTQNTEASDE